MLCYSFEREFSKARRAVLGGFVIALMASCRSNHEFPYLEHKPETNLLVGTYVFHPDTRSRLRDEGYSRFDGTIVVGEDGTFSATGLPGIWFGAKPSAGYDTLTGTWSAEQPVYRSDNYYLVIHNARITPNSAYWSAYGSDVFGQDPPLMMGIADATATRRRYALAVPLNNGDEGYLLMVQAELTDTAASIRP